MSNYRYSIIPGGAVTDPNLEPRDLQVLCLLGRHTDRLGWCFRSQVKMAAELRCGRGTIQRSLERLCAAGWAEKHERPDARIGPSGRPHSFYAYRVKIDRDDAKFDLSQYAVDDSDEGEGCPPMGTSPPNLGTGCPRMHGHQEGPPRDYQGGTYTRAREAGEIADEVARIAGIDPENPPAGWAGSGPAMRVMAFLAEGYTGAHLIAGAQECMANKRDGAPRSIEYFKHSFARAKGRAEAPVPAAVAPEKPHAVTGRPPRPGSREDRQERTTNALRKLNERAFGFDAHGQGGGREDHRGIPRLISVPKSAES